MTGYLTRQRIRDLLADHGLSPSRALGQNFLCDPAMVGKIVRLARVEPGAHVVEIGPGLGSLTLGLSAAGAKVLAVEIDRYIIPALETVLAEAGIGPSEVRIVNADAMTLDWTRVLDEGFPAAEGRADGPNSAGPDVALPPSEAAVAPPSSEATTVTAAVSDPAGPVAWSVIANLPYNVATPLILELLETQPRLTHWVVMVQREVGERLAAEPGQRASGIPSVVVSYFGTASIVGRVPPQLFLPQPNVDSVLVRIERSQTPRVDVDFAPLMTVVRAGFGQRRKMIRRSLSAWLSAEQIERQGISPMARAEELTMAQWAALGRLVTLGPEEEPSNTGRLEL